MSIYNEDELVPPSWINEEFLLKVLNHYEKCESVKINNFDISPATLKGDHYGSIMFRCKVSYGLHGSQELKNISFIIKTVPEEDSSKRDLLDTTAVFETEISMYSVTLPQIEKVLADHGVPSKMGAELIYYSLEPHNVLVMEDLCTAGYEVIRGRYLTEEEVKVVYQKIAKFHAATFIMGRSENREVVTKYQKGLFCTSAIMSMDLVRNGIWNLMQLLAEHEEFTVYLEKIKAMQPHINKNCMDLYTGYKLNQVQEDIFVLNHGDFHLKNLMFKFDKNNNQLEDVIMVDYQLSTYAASTIDTTYSQYYTLSPELRLRRNEFMLHYFTEFISALKKLNYQGEMPRYSDFQIASYKYRYFPLFLMSTFLPLFTEIIVSKAEDLKDIDSSNFMDNVDNIVKWAYKNPNYINDLRNFLPLLLRDGYLD